MQFRLIGITGKMGSGKTTAGEILKANHGFHRIAFGDILKNMIVDAGLLTRQQVIDKDPPARFILQRVGTEIIRKVDPDYFVKEMFRNITRNWKYKWNSMVIDDVRFQNEADMLRRLGGKLVQMHRNGVHKGNALTEHASEQEMASLLVNRTIDNSGTIPELEEKLDAMLREWKWTDYA